MFPQSGLGKWETGLCAGLFAFHPSILANMIHFNPDAGVITFLLLFWLTLWRDNKKWALLFALLTIFSKETACMLLPIPFIFCLLLQPRALLKQWFLQHAAILILPYITLSLFLNYKVIVRHQEAFWTDFHQDGANGLIWAILNTNSITPGYLGLIFVLNFQWLLLAVWAALLVVGCMQRLISVLIGVQKSYGMWVPFLLVLFFLAEVYFVTRIRTFANLRYVMVVFPIPLLGIFSLLPRFVVSVMKRMGIYISLFVLLGVQDFRLIDPLAEAYFGTFYFGAHKMLNMTARAQECCGYGQDQLVYNLEFLKFPETIAAVLQDIHPSAQTVITSASETSWIIWITLDKVTYRPTSPFDRNGFVPTFTSVNSLTNMFLNLHWLPNSVYFIALANDNSSHDITVLHNIYYGKTWKIYNLQGYQTAVWQFTYPITLKVCYP